MAEITHEDLDALAVRLETSFRRESDQRHAEMKDDIRGVHARVTELRDQFTRQNGRVGKCEEKLGDVGEGLRVLRHDFNNHLNVHGLAEAPPRPAASATTPDGTSKPGKAFVAGVAATIIGLAGIGQGAWDIAREYLPLIVKLFKP